MTTAAIDKTAITHEYAKAVAPLLGEGWVYVAPSEQRWWAGINGPDDQGLHLSYEIPDRQNPHGRYIWRVNYPRDKAGHEIGPKYGETRVSITTSGAKSPAEAVKDLKRRLLPAYQEQLVDCRRRAAENNAYEAATARNAERLGRALPGLKIPKHHTDTTTARMYLPDYISRSLSGDVTVSGESVSMELRSLTVDTAEAILRVLATIKREE